MNNLPKPSIWYMFTLWYMKNPKQIASYYMLPMEPDTSKEENCAKHGREANMRGEKQGREAGIYDDDAHT
ncbi:hypothetical protein ACJX0J_010583, partial [Zea mays]